MQMHSNKLLKFNLANREYGLRLDSIKKSRRPVSGYKKLGIHYVNGGSKYSSYSFSLLLGSLFLKLFLFPLGNYFILRIN